VKALVTGAAGFIGSHLASALLDRGAEVTGLDCFTDYYPRVIKEANLAVNAGRPGFHFVQGSLQHADLGALVDQKTHVFHLAAQAGVRKSWGADFRIYTELNVDATQRLLEACVGRPLHRFVYASSSSVYGDNVSIPMREDALPQPVSPYGVTKLAAEHLCHLYFVNHQVPATSVRYFTVYGPRQRPDMAFHKFIKAALKGGAVTLYGDGEQTRDFTYVTDAVAATIAAGETGVPGRAYNIGGGSRVSVNRLFEILGRIHGSPLTIRREPSQKGDMRDTFADSSLARQDLGFTPRVSLEEGLEAEYRWLAGSPALLELSYT
jgi:nucleoside-diphosphate-sugar epimerase